MKEEERRSFIVRTVIFGFSVSILAAVSLFFVLGVLSQAERSDIELSAAGSYTVRVIKAHADEKPRLTELAQSTELRKLLEVDELFLLNIDKNTIALCAGEFDSRRSEDAYSLLSKVREFEFGRHADIWLVSAGE